MFPCTISKLPLCFETSHFGAIRVHENALSAFFSSNIICYFLIIFSLASNQNGNYLVESQAELCASVCPTQQYWGSTRPFGAARVHHERGQAADTMGEFSYRWLQSSPEQRCF